MVLRRIVVVAIVDIVSKMNIENDIGTGAGADK